MGLSVDEKSVMEIGDKEKRRNKGKNKQQQPDSSIHVHYTLTYCPCVYQVSTLLASQSLRKVWWKLEIKKNEAVKGRISSSSLIPVYMYTIL